MMDSRMFDELGGGGAPQQPQGGGLQEVIRRLLAQKLAGRQADPGAMGPKFMPRPGQIPGGGEFPIAGLPRVSRDEFRYFRDPGQELGPIVGNPVAMPEPVSPAVPELTAPAGPMAQARPRPMRVAPRRFGGPSSMEY